MVFWSLAWVLIFLGQESPSNSPHSAVRISGEGTLAYSTSPDGPWKTADVGTPLPAGNHPSINLSLLVQGFRFTNNRNSQRRAESSLEH